MGGLAFSSGPDPLHTPRMPPNVYERIKAQCQAALRELFVCVASPIDGPGKHDYGDVDILVAWPKHEYGDTLAALEAVKIALAARRAILGIGQVSSNFAVRWPEKDSRPGQPETFVQVDVRICDTLDHLYWMLFKHAHGDIWNILGSTIRPYGLTINDDALYIRVPEIEQFNRKRSHVFLTAEPAEILDFLGLPADEFWAAPFPSLVDMFQYTAKCRLFWVRPAVPEDEIQNNEIAMVDGVKTDRAALKSNDRRRMNQRPAFRLWIEEFVAELRQKGLYSSKPSTRGAVTEEALCRFHIRDEFARRRDEFLLEKQKERINKLIKASSVKADPGDMKIMAYRAAQIQAIKRVVFEGDERYGMLAPPSIRTNDGLYNEDEIALFLQKNASHLGDAARALHNHEDVQNKSGETKGQENEAPMLAQG
ncbi:hypothetical protein LIA77_10962 [Sarocladium implicatum]|nr:hypothetical protein LIA77_10962 [Sarocladium implicatum]